MNLIDEAEVKNNKNDQNKTQKRLILILVAVAVLIVLAVLVYLMIQSQQNKQFKFFVDGKQISISMDNKLFRTADDHSFITDKDAKGNTVYYLSVRDFAALKSITGYSGYTGLPNSYIEHDYSNCYIENSYERTVFTVGETTITKTEKLNKNNTVEIPISNKIYGQGEIIYAPTDAIEKAFNCRINYNPDTHTFTIKTLSYLVQTYNNSYPLSAVKATNVNSGQPSYTDYQNQKALVRGYIVIKDPANGKLGLLNLNKSGSTSSLKGAKTIKDTDVLDIGLKYSSIRFMESDERFYVKTSEGKVGILSNDGTPVVNPVYKSIESLDAIRGLYVAQNDAGKYGVIDSNQINVIPFDYDQIGITDTYDDPNVTNKYVLLDFYVPVKNSDGFSFYSVFGNRLIDNQTFKGIGCVNNAKNNGNRGVVVIPELNAIVVSYSEQVTNDKGKITSATFYGIVGDLYAVDGHVSTMESIAGHFTQISASVSREKTTYNAIQEGTSVDLVEFVTNYYGNIQQSGQNTGEQANAVENVNNEDNNQQDDATPSEG